MKSPLWLLLTTLLLLSSVHSFAPPVSTVIGSTKSNNGAATVMSAPHSSSSSSLNMMDNEEKFGGYTVKQRLREEVESPFRTVRLYFFGSSTASAFVALYFSLLTLLKSYSGFSDAPPLSDAFQNVGINVAAVALCGYLTYRDYQAGEVNLKRIAKGGALAKLVVVSPDKNNNNALVPLSTYRRKQRVLICAGGRQYIQQVCRSLNSDQRSDTNTIPQALHNSEIIVVPVLLEGDGTTVGDASACWKETSPQVMDRDLDLTRSNAVVAFPRGNAQWADYLASEVETAKSQGFHVLEKGFIIVVKKNGKILKRATGLPPWDALVGTMEVMDGSKFGMPGDDEKYETP